MMQILTNRYSFPSALTLRDAMQEELPNLRCRVTCHPERISSSFIRYGNSNPTRVPESGFNSPELIRLSSNKLQFSRLVTVPTPKYYKDTPEEFPVLIRSTLSSSGGRGITVVHNIDEFNDHWDTAYYWTPFIKTSFELRVHVLGGQIARVFKKEFLLGDEDIYPIRNLHRGYHFALKQDDKYPKLNTIVETLEENLKSYNPQFYAMDCGWDTINKQYFVYEINTAPGLNEHTANLYAIHILKGLGLCSLQLPSLDLS